MDDSSLTLPPTRGPVKPESAHWVWLFPTGELDDLLVDSPTKPEPRLGIRGGWRRAEVWLLPTR